MPSNEVTAINRHEGSESRVKYHCIREKLVEIELFYAALIDTYVNNNDFRNADKDTDEEVCRDVT